MASKALTTNSESSYLPVAFDGFDWKDVVKDNLGGQAPGAFDLPRIRIPSGGGMAWTVPTLEGPEPAKEISGVIIHWQTMRGYWKVPFDQAGGGAPPDCASNDGEIGVGEPGVDWAQGEAHAGGTCSTCPLNQFGSGKDKAKACKEVRMLFLLREGDILPVAVPLAPMSIKPCKDYFMGLASEKRRPYHTVETVLQLEQAVSGGNIKYSKAKFGFGRLLTPEETAYVSEYRLNFTPILEARNTLDRSELES